jgi:caffeoyl-CoA O-methyltransferase
MTHLIDPAAERYAGEATTPFEGPVAAAVQWTAEHSPWPQMMAGLAEARLLELLVLTGSAQRVLEIGTFTGVGSLSLAAALPPGGRVTTLELDPEMAAVARRHIAASPHAERIEIIEGPALESLAGLEGPFDLVWIDAAKAEYVDYFEAALAKLAPRGVIAADNLFRAGDALDPEPTDPGTIAMHELIRRVREDASLHSVLLTVADGVLLVWRAPA